MGVPDLGRDPIEFVKSDGSPKNRLEMEEELRTKRKKPFALRQTAIYDYGLDKTKAYDMTEVVLRHWVLDEMIRRGLTVGDLAGVNAQTYNDDNEQRQFIQRLTALIQTGQAITPKDGEGIDMSNVPQPPGPPGYPQQPGPNGQSQQGFVPPPPPGMGAPQQGFVPPGPPQGFQPPAGGGFVPPQPQQPQQQQPQQYAQQPPQQYAQQPAPQQGFVPPQQPQYAQQPQQGFTPPGMPPGVPQQPMMPPGYAQQPGPPQGMPPGPPAGPPQQAQGGGRRRGGNKAEGQQQAAPPPAAPVPPMGPAPGFAPPPGPQMTMQQPMAPQPAAFPMPAQGFQPQQFAPQTQAPQQQMAPAGDNSGLQAQIAELKSIVQQQSGTIASLARNLQLANMGITVLSRAVYQKQGTSDIEGWLKELGVAVP